LPFFPLVGDWNGAGYVVELGVGAPVLRLPSGSESVTPNGTPQAKSPVLAFTAIRRPHGGLQQGQLPMVRPLASSSIQPMSGLSLVLTKI
jgi:hypothetical protein